MNSDQLVKLVGADSLQARLIRAGFRARLTNRGFFQVVELSTATLREALHSRRVSKRDHNHIYQWLVYRRLVTEFRRGVQHRSDGSPARRARKIARRATADAIAQRRAQRIADLRSFSKWFTDMLAAKKAAKQADKKIGAL